MIVWLWLRKKKDLGKKNEKNEYGNIEIIKVWFVCNWYVVW